MVFDYIRFLPFQYADAATNMAIDEAILEAHRQGYVPPTLRFYGFSPAAISLGYAQKLTNYIHNQANLQGLTIVRRPTGGRAVWHGQDLTYSFVSSSLLGDEQSPNLSPNLLLDRTILGAYHKVSAALIIGLEQIGVALSPPAKVSKSSTNECVQKPERSEQVVTNCFASLTSADLQHQGKKLIGSAQLRRRQGILQHGSIVLDSKSKSIEEKPLQLYWQGNTIPIATLQEAIKSGFEEIFQAPCLPSPLSEKELELSEVFRAKYRQKEL